ncbi:hypothetical protein ACJX0J_014599, partial [Zea mays]
VSDFKLSWYRATGFFIAETPWSAASVITAQSSDSAWIFIKYFWDPTSDRVSTRSATVNTNRTDRVVNLHLAVGGNANKKNGTINAMTEEKN